MLNYRTGIYYLLGGSAPSVTLPLVLDIMQFTIWSELRWVLLQLINKAMVMRSSIMKSSWNSNSIIPPGKKKHGAIPTSTRELLVLSCFTPKIRQNPLLSRLPPPKNSHVGDPNSPVGAEASSLKSTTTLARSSIICFTWSDLIRRRCRGFFVCRLYYSPEAITITIAIKLWLGGLFLL